MVLPYLLHQELIYLLICLTVPSRKDLSIAPCFYRGFFISYAGHRRVSIAAIHV
jgi:hypothetical protein